MSAVDEYRSNQWGMRAANSDGVGSGGHVTFTPRILADAAIAELEAEVACEYKDKQAVTRSWHEAEAERDALRDGMDDLRREVLAQLPTYSPTTKKLINKVFARWALRGAR